LRLGAINGSLKLQILNHDVRSGLIPVPTWFWLYVAARKTWQQEKRGSKKNVVARKRRARTVFSLWTAVNAVFISMVKGWEWAIRVGA
jgi:hypothetical protein